MNSSDDQNDGRRSDEAFELARHLCKCSLRDFDDELRDLACIRLRDQIRADAKERDQRLALQWRRQIRDEMALTFVGIVIALAVILPSSRVPPEVMFALVVFAGMSLARGRNETSFKTSSQD